MGEEDLLCEAPSEGVFSSSSSGTSTESVGVEVSSCVLTAGGGLMATGCVGALSGGAALQPSGYVRKADLERTSDIPAPLTLLSCGVLYATLVGAVKTACVDK